MHVLLAINREKDTLKLNILDDIFMTIPNVIYTRKNFFLLDIFNEKIELFKSAGLLQFWHYKKRLAPEPRTQTKKQPRVLTMERLNGCFYILMCGTALGFLSLILELYQAWKTKSKSVDVLHVDTLDFK